MLIPIPEIKENDDYYKFKTRSEISLIYQLEKILHLVKEVERGLDQQANDARWYFCNPRLEYDLDALMHNMSVLTEYYHGWIVFSHIGTIDHKKTSYSPLKNDEKLDCEIDRILKSNSIGVLKISQDDNGNFYEKCKKAFRQAYEFLLVGKFHEIFTLNNYLKHNAIFMGYSPKANWGDAQISIPYIYIERPGDRLLNPSVFKSLFDNIIDSNGKMKNAVNDYFVNIVNNTARFVCDFGSFNVYHINGIDYLKNDSTIGISVESIVEMAHELFENIAKVVMDDSSSNETQNKKLSYLLTNIAVRSPQTLNKLIAP